jgi:hypothetical protein
MQFHRGGNVSDVLLEVSATQDAGVTKGKIRYWRDDALIEDPLNPPTPMSNDNNYTPDELDRQMNWTTCTSSIRNTSVLSVLPHIHRST